MAAPVPYSPIPGIGLSDGLANIPQPTLGNTYTFQFGSSGVATPDTGLKRTAAGRLVINDTGSNLRELQLAGFLLGLVTKTGNYTAVQSDSVIIANAASLTITLPSAVTAVAGRVYIVKNGPSGTGTLIGATAGTIDGAAAPITPGALTSAYGVMRFISDGANWFTI